MSDRIGSRRTTPETASIADLAEQSASAPVVRSDCKLCLSKHRREIEDYYEQSSNIAQCHRLMKSKGEDVSYRNVRTHLTVHYAAIEQQEKVKKFTSELVRWRTDNIDKESRFSTVLAILERRMIDIAANIDGRGSDDTLKATETICKIASQIVTYQTELDNAKKDKEAVAHFMDQMQRIIRQHVEDSKSNEVKKGLIELVTSLEEQIGGLLPNGQTI
jgi:hypothetical protein